MTSRCISYKVEKCKQQYKFALEKNKADKKKADLIQKKLHITVANVMSYYK